MTKQQPPERNQQGINLNDNAKMNAENVAQVFGGNVVINQSGAAKRDRIEKILLDAVKTEVAGRQEYALHNRVYIELDKREDPSQVVQPWEYDVKEGSAAAVRCPAGMSVVEVFDREAIGGRLLILGAPGSGKTTVLLQLAEELVKRALADGDAPVPVLLNLSAWKKEFKDIRGWMVADLKLKYGVKKSKALEWIEERRILPLLDGLDELMSERQETCVRVLNEFLNREWPQGRPLVVCSRLEEYGAYPTNLGLNGSVTLLPLSDGQIERYLRGAGCDWLWDAVRKDLEVMDLVQSPLMLTIVMLVSDGLHGAELERWLGERDTTQSQRSLITFYVERQFKRQYLRGSSLLAQSGENSRVSYRSDADRRRWLGWLARRLRERGQTEFFFEDLQTDFLISNLQKSAFIFVTVLTAILILCLFHLAGIVMIVIMAFSFCIIEYKQDDNAFFQALSAFMGDLQSHFYKNPKGNSFFAVLVAMFYAGFSILELELLTSGLPGYFEASIAVIFFSLIASRFIQYTSKIRQIEISKGKSDNQRLYQSLISSLFLGSVIAPFSLTISSALYVQYLTYTDLDLLEFFQFGLTCGFFLGAICGGLHRVIAHISLRVSIWLFGFASLDYSRFLRYCTERGFLQRVGGGYRFVHALLRDHFADTEPCPGDPTAPPAR